MNPCCSGFQVQGTANSPAGMALFHSLLFQTDYRNIITDFLSYFKSLFEFFSLFLTFLSSVFQKHLSVGSVEHVILFYSSIYLVSMAFWICDIVLKVTITKMVANTRFTSPIKP